MIKLFPNVLNKRTVSDKKWEMHWFALVSLWYLLLSSPLHWLGYIFNRSNRVLGCSGDSRLDDSRGAHLHIHQKARDRRVFAGVPFISTITFQHVLHSLPPHVSTRSHVQSPHMHKSNTPCQLFSINSSADEVVCRFTPTWPWRMDFWLHRKKAKFTLFYNMPYLWQ